MSDQTKRMGAQKAPIQHSDNGTSRRLNSHVRLHCSTGARRPQVEAVNCLIDHALRLELRCYAKADLSAAMGYHNRAARWDRQGERQGAIRRELEALAWEVASHE